LLLRELIEQVEARFVELFGWNDGTLWFVQGAREPQLEVRALPCCRLWSRARSVGVQRRRAGFVVCSRW